MQTKLSVWSRRNKEQSHLASSILTNKWPKGEHITGMEKIGSAGCCRVLISRDFDHSTFGGKESDSWGQRISFASETQTIAPWATSVERDVGREASAFLVLVSHVFIPFSVRSSFDYPVSNKPFVALFTSSNLYKECNEAWKESIACHHLLEFLQHLTISSYVLPSFALPYCMPCVCGVFYSFS